MVLIFSSPCRWASRSKVVNRSSSNRTSSEALIRVLSWVKPANLSITVDEALTVRPVFLPEGIQSGVVRIRLALS